MAEALAAIGLASAVISFIDFGSRVIRQLRYLEQEVADQPRIFQGVRTRLPLMIDLVRKVQLQLEAGMVDKATQEHMLPIIRSCEQQAKQLDEHIRKAMPSKDDSPWRKGKKALSNVLQEPDIEKIDASLKQNFDLLLQAETFQSVSRIDEQGREHRSSPSFTMNPVFNVSVNLDENIRRRSSANNNLPPYDEMRRKDSQPGGSVFTVPFARDSNFLGRQSTIDEISKKFETQRIVSLAGLGGIGKSQIAIEYSYIFKELNPDSHVFWVYAGNEARFEHGYQSIARKLAIPGWDDERVDTLELVHEYLSDSQSGRYLLILDNADDASMFFRMKPDGREFSNEREFSAASNKTLAKYLPTAGLGLILITTRDKRVGERLSSREKAIDIAFMSPSDSIELLKSKIIEEDWDDSDGMRLAKELSYLPLALTQAAAFISENCISVSEYLDTLISGKEDMEELLSEHLEDTRRELDTENSVMRTWKLSFDHISRTMPRAADMLSLLAVLDLQGASTILLRREKESLTSFRTALGALQAFSLVNAGRGKDALCKMHRLVALSTQKWLENTGALDKWRSEALKLLQERFPADAWATPDDWPMIDSLIPHTHTVLSYPLTSPEDLLQAATLLGSVALYDLIRGKYDEAYRKSKRSLDIREAQLPLNEPLTLESANMVGESLLHRGRSGDLQAAKDTLTKTVKGRDLAIGAMHPDTLESVSDLTITLLSLDQLDAAMEMASRALKGREEVLGPHDRDTLVSLNIYGLTLQRQGKLEEAREVTERVLKKREQLLGPEQPDTLMTLNNLARLCIEQKEYAAAKEMLERALTGEAKALGAEGYDAQVSLSNMALVLQAQGEFDGAESVLRKVLAMRTKFSGPEHSSTILILQRLADLFDAKGDKSSMDAMTMRLKGLGVRGDASQPQAGALLRAGRLFD